MAYEAGQVPVPLFALIIGINDYLNYPKLRGAVVDAKAIQQYLTNILRVSEDHILTLYDDRATRHAIIGAFRALQIDDRIKRGDPILIFYSGHGSEHPAPLEWKSESNIQCLLPHDCEVVGTEPVPGYGPIPDRTIGALIEDIANVKSDNITVIFDCCFSASGTRDPDKDYIPRCVKFDLNIPSTLDAGIWKRRGGAIAHGFAFHGLWSHVLLAACGKEELAYERKGRGEFTGAILAMLENNSVNDLTYTDLLKGIRLKKQHPQCEGVHRHRVLFDARVPAGRQVRHPVHVHKGGKYIIVAGLAHGVSRGVEFTLYNDRKLAVGIVLVDESSLIDDFETTIFTSVPIADVSFAKLTRVGEVPLYVDPLSLTLETLQRVKGHGANFRLVEVEEARLEVATENDRVIFKVLDQQVKKLGLTELPHKTTLDSLPHVLASAAHFYWFLGLTKERERISTQDEVTVNFYLLNVHYDEDGLPLLSPKEPGYYKRAENLDDSGVIDFVVQPREYYGIKITNNTPSDLYLNAFLFNNSSLGIASYYTQSIAGAPEPPLKRGEIFTIGYGPGGIPPFSYSLDETQDVDVGYLKIFFATRPIDLSDIVQPSPFSNVNAREGTGDRARKGGWIAAVKAVSRLISLTRKHTWFTLDIPVVQRREKVHGAT